MAVLSVSTLSLIRSIQKKISPKLSRSLSIYLAFFCFTKRRSVPVIPMSGNANVVILNLPNQRKATRSDVKVVPIFAPMITAIQLLSVIIPAPTNTSNKSDVRLLLWVRPVPNRPSKKECHLLFVYFSSFCCIRILISFLITSSISTIQ